MTANNTFENGRYKRRFACLFAPFNADVSRVKPKSLLLATVLAVTGCDYLSDTVTRHYNTLEDARADQLFVRGWLPDLLPPSARDINTSNNLDLNTSTGGFSFTPSDGPLLYRHLKSGAPSHSRFEEWPNTVADYNRRGFTAWTYQESRSTWAFFCHPVKNQCDYFLW